MRPNRKPCRETSGKLNGKVVKECTGGDDVKVWTHEITIKVAMEQVLKWGLSVSSRLLARWKYWFQSPCQVGGSIICK